MDIPVVRQICSRPSSEQTRALLDELEVHPHLARGRSRFHNRRQCDKLWRDLTVRLNRLPGCRKSNKQWQKFWADKKSAVKKQVAAKQSEGLSVSEAAFGNTELRIINLIDKSDTVDENECGTSENPVTILDNLEGYTMSDDEDLNNPLLSIPLESESEMVLEIKKESKVPRKRNLEMNNRKRVIKSKSLPTNTTNKAVSTEKIFKKLLQMEKQRMEYEQRVARSLASIAACMKRQEEETQKLSTVLLEVIPRSTLPKYHSRVQTPRPSIEQVSALLDELEVNPYLAHGKLRKRSTPIWNAIGAKLNRIEGCQKTPRQWMKYWSDKKLSVKRLVEAVQTSEDHNGPSVESTLTDTEHRVIALLEQRNIEDTKPEFETPELPSIEAEYLDNENYLSDANDDIILAELKNPFKSIAVDNFEVKTEPLRNNMKQSLRGVHKTKNQLKKKRTQPLTPYEVFHRLAKMEERRLTVQESIINSLSEIEGCMNRQEESTQELARLLLRMIR